MYLPTAARAATDTGADSTEPNAALFLECVSTALRKVTNENFGTFSFQPQLSATAACLYLYVVPGRKAQ
jgi:hypothetical protein